MSGGSLKTRPTRPALPPQLFPQLTERGRLIPALIACGLSNVEVAEQLVVSLKTAQNHGSNIIDIGLVGCYNRGLSPQYISTSPLARFYYRRHGGISMLRDAARNQEKRLLEALRVAAPDLPPGDIGKVAHILIQTIQGHLSQSQAQRDLEHIAVADLFLRCVAGNTIKLDGAVVSFGAGSQTGDISIGKLAGGNIIEQIVIQLASDDFDVGDLPNPYQGLRPFTFTDQARFAGRERAIAAVLRQLVAPGAQRGLLFITGTSGCGKSSFAQAGLLPALVAHYTQQNTTVGLAVMRPGEQPLAALADALARCGLPAEGCFAPAALYLVRQPAEPRSDVGLLVIDQFEELFQQSEDGQAQGLIQILSALPPFSTLRAHIIVTLRSDYIPEVFNHQALYAQSVQGVTLRALNAGELRDAILRPLQVSAPERRIEPELLDRLVADAGGDEGYLPLLQLTLEDLWRRGRFRLAAYGGLANAIAQRAEEVYAYRDYDGLRSDLRPVSEQGALIAIMLDLIDVSLDDSVWRDARRARPLSLLGKNSALRLGLINDLAQARLVVVSAAQQHDMVDLIHDRVIGDWGRLQEAIGERRRQLQQRARFELALRDWLAEGQRPAYLLNGGRLDEARDLFQRDDIALQSAEARALLSQSIEQHERLQRQALALERRARRLFQGLAALLGVLAVAGLYLPLRTAWLRQQARGPEPLAVPVPGPAFEPFEVTNLRYRQCVEAGVCAAPFSEQSTYYSKPVEDYASYPVAGVDVVQAAAFCRWIGRRLPTYEQWGQVIFGLEQRAGAAAWSAMLVQANLAKPPFDNDTLLPVGVSGSATPEGIYDLLGNLWEWTLSPGDRSATWDGGLTVPFDFLIVAGGSFRQASPTLRPSDEPTAYPPAFRLDDIGFRCVE